MNISMKIIILLLLMFTFINPASAEQNMELPDPGKLAEKQLELLDLSQVEGFIRELDMELGEYLPDLSLIGLMNNIREGNLGFEWRDFFNTLLRYLFRELLAASSLLGKIVVLAVVCVVLKNLQAAFEKGTTSKLAYAITYLAMITLALGSFTLAVDTARGAIDQMVSFMQSIMPIIFTLMVAVGGPTSAALLHPVIVAALGVFGTLTNNIVFPLIYLSAVLGIVGQISDGFQVSRFAGLLRQIGITLIGLFLTVFVGTLSLYGIAGSVADGIALRTAKFLTGSFIPVVGKMLSDAVETVVGASLLVTSALHVMAVIVILAMAAFPGLKILALVIIYKLAAALIQPFGDTQMSEALDAMGNSLIIVFAAVIAVGLMFFVALSAIVGVGNMTVMLR
ncbi:MAG: stage III sporulation protein AE [Syntrophomonadaceae bacterium]|nr:stage III sporulation protein AE [Syntrophomonadaceae bacterium]